MIYLVNYGDAMVFFSFLFMGEIPLDDDVIVICIPSMFHIYKKKRRKKKSSACCSVASSFIFQCDSLRYVINVYGNYEKSFFFTRCCNNLNKKKSGRRKRAWRNGTTTGSTADGKKKRKTSRHHFAKRGGHNMWRAYLTFQCRFERRPVSKTSLAPPVRCCDSFLMRISSTAKY